MKYFLLKFELPFTMMFQFIQHSKSLKYMQATKSLAFGLLCTALVYIKIGLLMLLSNKVSTKTRLESKYFS